MIGMNNNDVLIDDVHNTPSRKSINDLYLVIHNFTPSLSDVLSRLSNVMIPSVSKQIIPPDSMSSAFAKLLLFSSSAWFHLLSIRINGVRKQAKRDPSCLVTDLSLQAVDCALLSIAPICSRSTLPLWNSLHMGWEGCVPISSKLRLSHNASRIRLPMRLSYLCAFPLPSLLHVMRYDVRLCHSRSLGWRLSR